MNSENTDFNDKPDSELTDEGTSYIIKSFWTYLKNYSRSIQKFCIKLKINKLDPDKMKVIIKINIFW